MAGIDPGLVAQAAAGSGVPANVVRAQIQMESGGNPNAVSPTGAQGEFQFEPGTFKAQGTGGNPFNPKDEVKAYNKLMGTLLRQYHGNVRTALAAYNAGPGNIGAGLGYADTILKNAGASAGLSASPSRTTTFSIPGQPIKSQIGGGLNTEALALAVLQKEAARPIDTSGKVTAGANPLKDYVAAEQSGHYNTATQNVTDGTTPATQGSLRTDGHVALAGHGDNVNPLGQGWSLGRTDMGVDANAAPGTPIHAVNDSKVVEVVPNWYKGQPLVLMQLTAGPDAGKYWYVSEQIHSNVHVGETVPRGSLVATYAPTGTGIEIGWGDPHTNSRTAAAHYTEGQVTPEGQSFRSHILGG